MRHSNDAACPALSKIIYAFCVQLLYEILPNACTTFNAVLIRSCLWFLYEILPDIDEAFHPQYTRFSLKLKWQFHEAPYSNLADIQASLSAIDSNECIDVMFREFNEHHIVISHHIMKVIFTFLSSTLSGQFSVTFLFVFIPRFFAIGVPRVSAE